MLRKFRPKGWSWWYAVAVLGGLGLPVVLMACGTIIHGTSQDVAISSQPTGADVTIDNTERGTTPVTADLDRGEEHSVRIDMEGYQPYEMNITKSVSGWVWGNIVFGGLIGLAVDAISGGLYKLEPDQIEAELKEGTAGALEKDGTLHIRVVLDPDDDWEKIGQLDPHHR